MNIAKLYSEGRAKSPFELWSPEENEAVHLLANERSISRLSAAEYVRNGILTLEDFDKAAKKGFKPETFENAFEATMKSLKTRGTEVVRKRSKK